MDPFTIYPNDLLDLSYDMDQNLQQSYDSIASIPTTAEHSALLSTRIAPRADLLSSNAYDSGLAFVDPALRDLAMPSSQLPASTAAESNLPVTPSNVDNRNLRLEKLGSRVEYYDRRTSVPYSSPYGQSDSQTLESSPWALVASSPQSAPADNNPFRTPATTQGGSHWAQSLESSPSPAMASSSSSTPAAPPPSRPTWVTPQFHPFCCCRIQTRVRLCDAFLRDHPVVATILFTLFTNPKSPEVNGSLQPIAHINHLNTAKWLVSVQRILPKYPHQHINHVEETKLEENVRFYMKGDDANVWLPNEWVKIFQQPEIDYATRRGFKLVDAYGYEKLRLGCQTHRREYAVAIWAEKQLADAENNLSMAIYHDRHPKDVHREFQSIHTLPGGTRLQQAKTRTHNQAFDNENDSEGSRQPSYTPLSPALHRYPNPQDLISSRRASNTNVSFAETLTGNPGASLCGVSQTQSTYFRGEMTSNQRPQINHHSLYPRRAAGNSQMAPPTSSGYAFTFHGSQVPAQYDFVGSLGVTSGAYASNMPAQPASDRYPHSGGSHSANFQLTGQNFGGSFRGMSSTSQFPVRSPQVSMTGGRATSYTTAEGFVEVSVARQKQSYDGLPSLQTGYEDLYDDDNELRYASTVSATRKQTSVVQPRRRRNINNGESEGEAAGAGDVQDTFEVQNGSDNDGEYYGSEEDDYDDDNDGDDEDGGYSGPDNHASRRLN